MGRESESDVGASYDRMAQVYFEHVWDELDQPSLVRSALSLFAELVGPEALTLDAGCGPGHVTSFLASKGLRISGVDISPALVSLAEATFPNLSFGVASLAELPTDASSLAGLVSRHSIIHTEPDRLDDVVSEFARVLAPQGCLFLSFFALAESGVHAQPFDHAVCTAYQLDPSLISKLLARHGLIEEIQLIRRPREGERQLPHATLIARRS